MSRSHVISQIDVVVVVVVFKVYMIHFFPLANYICHNTSPTALTLSKVIIIITNSIGQ